MILWVIFSNLATMNKAAINVFNVLLGMNTRYTSIGKTPECLKIGLYPRRMNNFGRNFK